MKENLILIKSHQLLRIACGLIVTAVPMTSSALDDFVPEEKAYYLCAGCHGPETGGVLYPMPHDIPVIIGQKKDYLLKQLLAYRDGQREHPNMSRVLTNYTDQNLADLAEYYQNLGPKRPERMTPRVGPRPIEPVINTPLTQQPALHNKKAKKGAANPPSSSNQAQ